MKKISGILSFILSCALMTGTIAWGATDWPNDRITLLCGLSAGGSSDLGSRYLADALGKELGVPVIVENLTGSGSWIAWNRLLHNTKRDGNTFAFVNHNVVFGEYDQDNPREDGLDDFELLLGQAVEYTNFLVNAKENRFNNLKEFVAYAQKNVVLTAAQGTGITDGDASLIEAMRKYLGCKIDIVPTDGGSESMAMLLAGDIDFYLQNTGSAARALADKTVKDYAIFAPTRSTMLPDVPTAKELGITDLVAGVVRGFAYPKGVDPEIVSKMKEAMERAMTRADYLKNMRSLNIEPVLMKDSEFYNMLSSQLDSRLAIWGLQKKK